MPSSPQSSIDKSSIDLFFSIKKEDYFLSYDACWFELLARTKLGDVLLLFW